MKILRFSYSAYISILKDTSRKLDLEDIIIILETRLNNTKWWTTRKTYYIYTKFNQT